MASNVNIEEEEEEQREERKEGRNRRRKRRKRKRKGRINVEHRMMVSFQFNISGAQCNLHFFFLSFYRLKHGDSEICLVTYICFPKLKSKILSYETVGILTSEFMYYMP